MTNAGPFVWELIDNLTITGLLLGDTDAGGTITMQDAIDLFNLVIGGGPFPPNVDVNGDGNVDMFDVMTTFWYVVQRWDCWPGQPGCGNQVPWNFKTSGLDFALRQPNETDVPRIFEIPVHLISGVPNAFALSLTYDPSELSILTSSMDLPKGWSMMDQAADGRLVYMAAGSSILQTGQIASIEVALIDGVHTSSIQAEVLTQDGSTLSLGTVEVKEIPDTFVLEQNYPNPFNPSTQIHYALPEASDVELIVYDQLGHEVRRLISSRQEAGHYDVTFDATNLASGMYIYRFRAGATVMTKPMLLVK